MVFLDVVVAAVGTSRLDIEVIGPVGGLRPIRCGRPNRRRDRATRALCAPSGCTPSAETHNAFYSPPLA